MRVFVAATVLPMLMATGSIGLAQTQTPFRHPGMLHGSSDLELLKQKIAAGEQPWKDAFENLRNSASLNFQPRPVAHVVRGSYGRGSTGDRELSNSAGAAYSHALLWAITGDKAHATKAIEILNAWSPVLWDFDDNDAKLLAGWTGHNFCNAAEILRYTQSGWQQKDIAQFERMLLTVYYPLIKDFFPEANGNWDGAMIDTMLCIGVFCDNREIFDRAVNHFLRGEGNGGITKYIFPNGQCQESTRDQSHTQLGLGEFAQACQVAWTQGVDLYGAADNRLALGLEYTAKYMLGEDVSSYGVVSAQGRGRFSDIYQSVYQHYHEVKGLDMPYTARAVEATRARSSIMLLASCRAPLAASAQKEASADTSNHRQASLAAATQSGALTDSTAQAPADANAVQAGQPIQAALDGKARAGGWVTLGKGVHTLPAALRLPSGVTLAGMGRETILFLDPRLTGPAIVNADDDLHDVTLRDFVVEGATTPKPSSDGNQDRRQRSYQMAPSRAGIALSSQHQGQMRNIRLEHVTVRNCTHNGAAIRGAAQVVVTACDFSDNGSSGVPGPGLQHDLLITRVTGCQLSDNRLDGSLWGSGLDLSHSRDVTISGNEVARNARHGIHATESEEVRVSRNVAEGNDGSGIVFDAMAEGCRRIEVRDNLVQNNGGSGIDIRHAADSTVGGNTISDNGQM